MKTYEVFDLPGNLKKNEMINTSEVFDNGILRVEHNYFYISCNHRILSLGRAEFLIISILARHWNRFISSQDIWKYIWNENKPFNQESLKVIICSLRRRLKPSGIFIESKTKIGYRLVLTEYPEC